MKARIIAECVLAAFVGCLVAVLLAARVMGMVVNPPLEIEIKVNVGSDETEEAPYCGDHKCDVGETRDTCGDCDEFDLIVPAERKFRESTYPPPVLLYT